MSHLSVDDRLKMRFIIPDGYDKKTKTCYFYDGCYWHFHKDPNHTWTDEQERERKPYYMRTLYQTDKLKKEKYNVKRIWECKWEKMKQENKRYDFLENKTIREFLKDNEEQLKRPYASVRDSYSGGRTEPFNL